MFILVIINFWIICFVIKYLFINYFSHINFINGYFKQIYLLMVSLTVSSLGMFNFAIINFSIKYLFIN
jgi:hypothetical protein